MTSRVVLPVALSVAAAMLLAGCSGDGTEPVGTDDPAAGDRASDVVIAAEEPAALAVAPSGTLFVGERRAGRIVAIREPYGTTDPIEISSVAVASADRDQRGLLGLAVDPAGRVYASYTRVEDRRLVVAEVAAAREDGSVTAIEPRLVWRGPRSTERANGGHIAIGPDGRLVIGIGDLLDRERVDDADAPNGKMLALRSDGGADQRPAVLSTGWNNPFAFAFDRDGVLWVADNAGPAGSERIGRGDQPNATLSELRPADDQMAPSGLVPLSDGTLGVCGFLEGRVLRVDVEGDRAVPTAEVVIEPCRLGVAALGDGRLAVADLAEVIVAGTERGEG